MQSTQKYLFTQYTRTQINIFVIQEDKTNESRLEVDGEKRKI